MSPTRRGRGAWIWTARSLSLALLVAVGGPARGAELGPYLTIERVGEPLASEEGPLHQVVVHTDVLRVEGIHKSMEGPWTAFQVSLLPPGAPPELLWLKSIDTVVVAADGQEAPQELMCHVSVNHNLGQRKRNLGHRSLTSRLSTLSQGQFRTEMPKGFAIPIFSTEALRLDSMVLNHNVEDGRFDVRHRITLSFLRDSELDERPRPLMGATVSGRPTFKDGVGYVGRLHTGTQNEAPTCLPGEQVAELVDREESRRSRSTGHWLVPPGRQLNETLVTRQLGLPYDTAIHRIDVHLHPFAESLELRDLTTGDTLFLSRATAPAEGVGLARVETLESSEGIAVYADHDYGLISVYENHSDADQTAMAVMYLQLEDKEFDRRQIDASLSRLRAEAAGED